MATSCGWRYNGPANFIDIPHALAVDAAGNVYVTGRSAGSGRLNDYATIKYDADGNQVWVARFAASSGSGAPNSATALAVDAAGNVYVTGQAFGRLVGESGDAYDYMTIKYDADGNQIWLDTTGRVWVTMPPPPLPWAVTAAACT